MPSAKRLPAAVEIVELGLRDRVVHVDGRNQQRSLLHHLVKPVHAGRRLFRNAAPILHNLVPVLGIIGKDLLQQVLDDLLFVIIGRTIDPLVAVFQFIALVDQQGCVAAVVHDQLRPQAALEGLRAEGAIPILFQRLALPGEDRHSGGGNGRGGVVLRREDVAACPAHLGAQSDQRLNQHGRLNGHVQRSGDAHPCQRLRCRVLVADRHQSRHLLLGDGDFLAAPVSQREVGYFVFRIHGFNCGRHFDSSYSPAILTTAGSRTYTFIRLR
jgi:hypothetical protein